MTRLPALAVVALLAGPAGAAPPAAFPIPEADFGAVLDWVTAADGDARDRYVEAAGQVVEGSTDAVAVAQVELRGTRVGM